MFEGEAALYIDGTGPMYDFESPDDVPWEDHTYHIKSVFIDPRVTGISAYAFSGHRYLTDIVIPAGIASIGEGVFSGCDRLSVIEFTGDAPVIASDAFTGVTAIVTYPEGDETWTPDILHDHGGTLTWIPVGEYLGLEQTSDPVIPFASGDTLDLSGIRAMPYIATVPGYP